MCLGCFIRFRTFGLEPRTNRLQAGKTSELELLVSGDAIGSPANATTESLQ
jgi:hypothetical protein